MNHYLKLIVIISLCFSTSFATCKKDQLVFSCVTKKGKKIEVCDKKSAIEYSFGKLNTKPEISINIPRNKATTFQWDGMGPMSYSVNIPNKNTIYNIFWSMDRMSDEHTIQAGVNVFIDEKFAATVECATQIESNMEGIDLFPTNNY